MNIGDSGFVQRISPAAENGILNVTEIPNSEPVLIAFGGENTFDNHAANYYLGKLYRVLVAGGIKKPNVYAVTFNVEAYDSGELRYNAFERAGRKLSMEYRPTGQIQPTTKHIVNFYDVILKPRLFDGRNKKLDINTAIKRIRQVKFFSHCHGATIIQELAKIMADKMLAGGYTVDDIKQIQSQLLVLQYAPVAPMEKNIFPTISFASSSDTLMQSHLNHFSDYITKHADNLPPAFFAAPRGNIFVANQLGQSPLWEHQLEEITDITNPNKNTFTDNGKIIYTAMYNALVRGAKHSLNGGELPDVKTLTNGNGVDFDLLRKNGDIIYTQMVTELRNLKHNEK